MEIVLAIIFITFGILQIILFFKLWAMANNVKQIQKELAPKSIWTIRKALLKGDKEAAKGFLIDELISDIKDFYENSDSKFKDMQNIKEFYRPIFEKLDFKIPEEIEKLENWKDIKDLV